VIIEVRALLGRGESLPEAMVESSLMCATVGGVAAYGIHGGAGSRSQARARRRHHLRLSSASSETEIAPEGKPSVGRGGDLRPRAGTLLLSY
jgi:hypothetical protein